MRLKSIAKVGNDIFKVYFNGDDICVRVYGDHDVETWFSYHSLASAKDNVNRVMAQMVERLGLSAEEFVIEYL